MNNNIQSNAMNRRIAVVTGGSSGIGQQIAADLASQRYLVIICSRQQSNLDQAKMELNRNGFQVDTVKCDIRSNEQVNQLSKYILDKYGHIDLLVNNAGYAVYRSFEESTSDEVLDILDVNLAGTLRCTKAFLPSMIKRQSGRIVNISSMGGETIITPNAVYCAAKHGMVALTKALRYELQPFNIRVNVICPAFTKTHFHDHISFRRRDPYRNKKINPLTVKEVSTAVLRAIYKDRIVTYVPLWQGLLVWFLKAIPIFIKPIWDRISIKRVKQLYEQIDLEREM